MHAMCIFMAFNKHLPTASLIYYIFRECTEFTHRELRLGPLNDFNDSVEDPTYGIEKRCRL